ncbi:PREDICTED: secreted Ly-6/uPAR-related protein 1 [Lipotes vexillifer]|uniref:Secreted Ly-6/uPAR-related protein 1 n=1 Tax=Lipotes vexillifer TaxID=118797 RepID=A0A340XTT2_LIPVE|nr:PREDICTED: secreted Ly-6/uPAR-related protein 1 [Lipotes vexillifer]
MCKTTLYSLEMGQWGRGPAAAAAHLSLNCELGRVRLAGEALRCFTCEQPTALPLCETITNCKPEDTACKTSQLTAESGEPCFNHSPGVTSSCSSSCDAADPDSIGAARPSYCCSHDLCNSMGVARLSAGALAARGP